MILNGLYRQLEKLMKIRILPVIVWGLVLGLHTWTENLGDLLRTQTIAFRWIASPDYMAFFNMDDITRIHHDFIVVKTGHFMGFAIFDFLVFRWLSSHKRALAISFAFALTTEILQLFFGRDGRLYDVTIDSLGALSVYFVLKSRLFPKVKSYLMTRKVAGLGALVVLLAIFGALGYEYVQVQPKSHFKKVSVFSSGTHVASGAKKKQRKETVSAFNILLMGSDERQGETIGHSDTVMLVHVDLEKNQVYAVSLPRDLRVHLDGYGNTKLASVQYILQAKSGPKQGIAQTVKVISRLTGVPIQYFAETNFAGLQSMVNALGGIPMKVPANEKIGSQLLHERTNSADGNTVLSLDRSLSSFATGDYGRQQLQLETLIGIAKKAVNVDNIPKISALVHVVSKNLIATNLSPSDLLSLGLEMKSFNPDKDFHYQQLHGADEDLYDDVLMAKNDEIVIDSQKMESTIARFFKG